MLFVLGRGFRIRLGNGTPGRESLWRLDALTAPYGTPVSPFTCPQHVYQGGGGGRGGDKKANSDPYFTFRVPSRVSMYTYRHIYQSVATDDEAGPSQPNRKPR